MVERTAVNRDVVGSSPTRGAEKPFSFFSRRESGFFCVRRGGFRGRKVLSGSGWQGRICWSNEESDQSDIRKSGKIFRRMVTKVTFVKIYKIYTRGRVKEIVKIAQISQISPFGRLRNNGIISLSKRKCGSENG